MVEQNYWRKCGSCKKEINFRAIYQKCSVSTCRKLVFCSVNCWDLHVPVMNHKSAWAEEERAPSIEEALGSGDEDQVKRRIIVQSSQKTMTNTSDIPHDVLIVTSKLKAFVKAKHDLNTSADVIDILSDLVRRLCDDAAEKARADGRKTLMSRDF